MHGGCFDDDSTEILPPGAEAVEALCKAPGGDALNLQFVVDVDSIRFFHVPHDTDSSGNVNLAVEE